MKDKKGGTDRRVCPAGDSPKTLIKTAATERLGCVPGRHRRGATLLRVTMRVESETFITPEA